MPDLLVETRDHVTTITLNRPERLNAISGAMLTRLSEELLRCDRDPDVRVILLTGAGRGFCSGLDLKDAAAGGPGDPAAGADALKIGEMPPFVLHRIDTPVVCALNGPASGYGMDMALSCDFVLASDRASFAPPVRRGVVPESGGTWLLPRLVGWQKASEVILLARKLDAGEIDRLGLANRIVPHDELLSVAWDWAVELAANAPLAVAAAKRSMRLGLESSFDANAYHVMGELLQLFRTEDFREGLQAFMEKRTPTYRGR
ncbi:MAG: enoyl-CoA hydratase/isomerase family protein [Myxococcota bacterium]